MFNNPLKILPSRSFGLEWPRRRGEGEGIILYDRSIRRPSSALRPGSAAHEAMKPTLGARSIIALDPALSGSGDHSALVVIERTGHGYDLRYATRMKGRRVGELINGTKWVLDQIGDGLFVIDRTGLGLPIFQHFQDQGLQPFPVVITGSQRATFTVRGASVPSRDLVNNLQILLEQGRLRIAKELPATPALETELYGFRVSYSESGHDRYAAGSGISDDLVFALMLGLYVAEKTANRFAAAPSKSTV